MPISPQSCLEKENAWSWRDRAEAVGKPIFHYTAILLTVA